MNRFMRKLNYETKQFVKKTQKLEENKLMEEVMLILDNNFFILEYEDENDYLEFSPVPSMVLDETRCSDESFCDNDVSELLSIRSFNIERTIVSEQTCNFIEPCSKRIKLDFELDEGDTITGDTTVLSELLLSREDDPIESEEQRYLPIVLEKIKKLKSLPKNLNSKKEMFALYRASTFTWQELTLSWQTTTNLIVSNLHFSDISQKVGQTDYFLLVTCKNQIQTSKFVKTKNSFITFKDIFVFDNCAIDFRIKVQLYVLRLNAKLKMKMKQFPIMKSLIKWYNSRRNEEMPSESKCFKLVDQFELTCADLSSEIATIRDKVVYSKNFKYSLEVDRLNSESRRSGHLKFYLKNNDLWMRCWCELSDMVFKIFKSLSDESEPVLLFNLKYATYAKIDQNCNLIVHYVRPSQINDENNIVLNSRNNFVVVKLLFKACNLRYLKLWERDINAVIKTIDEWKISFLHKTELEI